MRTETGNFSSMMLTGTILLAGVDVTDLLNYGLRAVVGGAVWLGFRYVADYIERKRKKQ
jgi:hypothetical protein